MPKDQNNLQDFQIRDLYNKHEEVNKAVGKIANDITIIKDNHLTNMEVDLAKTTTNVDWLLRYHWVVATASIGALIAGLINLIK